MNRAAFHEGVRRMRFSSILARHTGGELTQIEAAEMLGIHERTFRRWQVRFETDGEAGLADLRLGRPSPRRAPRLEIERMLGLFRERYADFTVKHFHEQLGKRHGYRLGYTVTKVHLHRAGLVQPAVKRSAHRKKRARRPLIGLMLHQDGSRHAWLEGQAPMDLIVTLDDATGALYSIFLVEEEGTASTFQGLREVVQSHGLFCALYTDRGSHYFHTPEAGGKVDRTRLTQVGRALAQLGVVHIPAYSPEARGRSERMFQTLQDRLIKELALAGITTVDGANRFIRDVYLPAHNARFAVKAEQEGSAFVPVSGIDLNEILCVQEERQVGNDNTVIFHRLRLQIPPGPLRRHFVKARVKVRRYSDGTHAIFHGPRCLGRYDADGALREEIEQAA
jgi:transposase